MLPDSPVSPICFIRALYIEELQFLALLSYLLQSRHYLCDGKGTNLSGGIRADRQNLVNSFCFILLLTLLTLSANT